MESNLCQKCCIRKNQIVWYKDVDVRNIFYIFSIVNKKSYIYECKKSNCNVFAMIPFFSLLGFWHNFDVEVGRRESGHFIGHSDKRITYMRRALTEAHLAVLSFDFEKAFDSQ